MMINEIQYSLSLTPSKKSIPEVSIFVRGGDTKKQTKEKLAEGLNKIVDEMFERIEE